MLRFTDQHVLIVIFAVDAHQYASAMPNKLRELAEGEDLVTVFIPLWADDVSGARSKQYQKHVNVYMANQNLPGRLLQQEYFVKFISTSPHASALEQFEAIMPIVKFVLTFKFQHIDLCLTRSLGRHTRIQFAVIMLPHIVIVGFVWSSPHSLPTTHSSLKRHHTLAFKPIVTVGAAKVGAQGKSRSLTKDIMLYTKYV